MGVSDSGVFASLCKYPAVRILVFFLPGTISGTILAHHMGNEAVYFISAVTAIAGMGTLYASLISGRSRGSALLLVCLTAVCFTDSYLSYCAELPGASQPAVNCEDELLLIGEGFQVIPGEGSGNTSRIIFIIRSAFTTGFGRKSLHRFSNRKALLSLSGPVCDFSHRTFAVVARFLGLRRYWNTFEGRPIVPASRGPVLRFKADVRDCLILNSSPHNGRRPFSPEALKRICSDSLRQWLDTVPSSFLQAVLLGERDPLTYERKEVLKRAGAYHILAVSGVHIGLLAMILLAVTGAAGVSRGHSIRICIMLLSGYVILIGGSISSIRAYIMVTIFLSAFLYQRYRSSVNSLAVAAIVILSLYPFEIVGPGFLLSFTAVTGILISTTRGGATEHVRGGRSPGLNRRFVQGVRISLSAFLAQMPVMVFFFGTLYPVSVVSNLVILPVFGLSLALGLSFLPISLMSARAAFFLAPVVDGSVDFIFRAAELFGRTPDLRVTTDRMPIVMVISLIGLLLLSSVPGRRKALYSICFLSILPLQTGTPFIPIAGNRDSVRMAFLDVGEGDCCVIESVRDGVIIIDTGDTGHGTVESQVVEYLDSRGIRRIDLLVLTHPHDDHFGDADEILKRFKVSGVIGIEPWWKSESYAELLRLIQQRRIPFFPAAEGDTVRSESACFAVLGPGPSPPDECRPSENDHSLVMKFTTLGKSILFPGDAESCAESVMAGRYGRLMESDVLKAGHHGSRTSTTNAFLDDVGPKIVVISCDRAGKFEHPSPDVVDRLKERGMRVYRTDVHGGILLEYEPGGEIRVSTSYPE